MKYMLPALAIALLAAVGCQDNSKSSAMSPSNPSVTDIPMTPSPIITSTPAVFEPTPALPAATVTPAMDTTPSLASGATYKVKTGDTLWKLAALHYGNGNQWKKIADANPGLTPTNLKVGQTITIP
jgi:5'-nucleotidase